MKVVLVSSFEERFLEQDTLPELARRGIEVVSRFEAKDARSYDFHHFKRTGVSLILHMHEVGPHCSSEALSRLAREAEIPIKALSRKKASWTFLPPPRDGGPPSMKPEASLPNTPAVEKRRGLGSHLGTLNIATGVTAAFKEEREYFKLAEGFLHASLSSDIPLPPDVEKFLKQTRFDRRTARLRDVVQLVLGHNIKDPDRVLSAVMEGRETGVFPRLMRLKKDDIPKLVAGILEQETGPGEAGKVVHMTLDAKDRERFEAIGLTDPNLATLEESAARAAKLQEEEMQNAKVVPMQKPMDELDKLKAKVAEMEKQHAEYAEVIAGLEKFKKAHAALRTLVQVGMMSPVEAAEKLFQEPLG